MTQSSRKCLNDTGRTRLDELHAESMNQRGDCGDDVSAGLLVEVNQLRGPRVEPVREHGRAVEGDAEHRREGECELGAMGRAETTTIDDNDSSNGWCCDSPATASNGSKGRPSAEMVGGGHLLPACRADQIALHSGLRKEIASKAQQQQVRECIPVVHALSTAIYRNRARPRPGACCGRARLFRHCLSFVRRTLPML